MITLRANPDFIAPSYRRNEVLGFLKNNTLEDLCISRPAARLNWGIPIPFDPAFVTYVWFDALSNYISVPVAHGDTGVSSAVRTCLRQPAQPPLTLWPADLHIIGKDILKFHAVSGPSCSKQWDCLCPNKSWSMAGGRRTAKK